MHIQRVISGNIRVFLTLCVFFSAAYSVSAQVEITWETAFDYTFDNREYDESRYELGYTLSGIRIRPSVVAIVHDRHTFCVGVNALKEHGTHGFLDKLDLSAYYRFGVGGLTFQAGVFDKKRALHGYSDRFIDEYDYFYNPLMSGIFLEYNHVKHGYLNTWLEWITKKNETERERLHAGASGAYYWGRFFAQANFRMMHMAATEPLILHSGVVEELQGEIVLGWRDMDQRGPDYRLGIGTYGTIERDRVINRVHRGLGLIAVAEVSGRGIGLDAYFYYGTGHQKMREEYGRTLFYGNPFLQAEWYGQSKFYWNIIRDDWVDMRLNLGLEVVDSGVFSRQTLNLIFRIGSHNIRQKNAPLGREAFPWLSLFGR